MRYATAAGAKNTSAANSDGNSPNVAVSQPIVQIAITVSAMVNRRMAAPGRYGRFASSPARVAARRAIASP